MIYEYFKEIDITDKFKYVSMIIASILLFSRIPVSGTNIIGLIIGICLVIYINDKRKQEGDTFLSAMNMLLSSPLMKPQYNRDLPRNSEFVIFIGSHQEYYHYNPMLWNQFVRLINNYLKLDHEIKLGTEHYNMDYDALKDIKRNIMNVFHAFIHKLPHTVSSNDKFHRGMARLEELLKVEVDTMHRLIAKKNSEEINSGSVFHYKNHPRGFEKPGIGKNTRLDNHYTYF